MMAHLISTLPIVLNAPNQYIEGLLGIEQSELPDASQGHVDYSFSVHNAKLVLFRTAVMGVLLFLGETLPNFGAILDLIGGSTVTLLTFVFPPIFYLLLRRRDSADAESGTLRLLETCYCVALVAMGAFGGSLATYGAVKEIFNTDFVPPCYA